MRTDQIIYLNEINRRSSLHQASENLHISTQALSLSIKSLEEELGFQILERSRTGVTLTKKGEALLHIGKDFLEQLQNIQTSTEKKYQTSLTGTFEILATNGIIETLFPPLISQLFFDYPDFHLKPISSEFSLILDPLVKDIYEFALIYQCSINDELITSYDNSMFSFSPILSGSYYCTIPENFSIAHYKSISLNTMTKYPIILFSPTKGVLLKLFEYTNKKCNIIFVDNYSVYTQMLAKGAGLSLTLVIDQSKLPVISLPNLKLIPFKERIYSDLGYIYKKDHSFSLRSDAFIKYLKEYLDIYGIQNFPISE